MPLHFGEDLAEENKEMKWFADFQREVEMDANNDTMIYTVVL